MSGPFLSLFFSEDLSLFGAVEILFRKVGRGRASYVKLAPYTCQASYGPLPTYCPIAHRGRGRATAS